MEESKIPNRSPPSSPNDAQSNQQGENQENIIECRETSVLKKEVCKENENETLIVASPKFHES